MTTLDSILNRRCPGNGLGLRVAHGDDVAHNIINR